MDNKGIEQEGINFLKKELEKEGCAVFTDKEPGKDKKPKEFGCDLIVKKNNETWYLDAKCSLQENGKNIRVTYQTYAKLKKKELLDKFFIVRISNLIKGKPCIKYFRFWDIIETYKNDMFIIEPHLIFNYSKVQSTESFPEKNNKKGSARELINEIEGWSFGSFIQSYIKKKNEKSVKGKNS